MTVDDGECLSLQGLRDEREDHRVTTIAETVHENTYKVEKFLRRCFPEGH